MKVPVLWFVVWAGLGLASAACGGRAALQLPATDGSAGPPDAPAGARDGSPGGSADGSANGADRPRALNVTATRARHAHGFLAGAADPDVRFNDSGEVGLVDPRAPRMVGKLVLPFGGVGSTAGAPGGAGQFCAVRGFHVLAVAAFENYDIVLGDPDFYGDARAQEFDGLKHTTTGAFASIQMGPADGVAQRVQMGLKYLQGKFPEEDWGYYLDAAGEVRWSDVIFAGMSHGASDAARFAMMVGVSRVVSVAGPRDNLCTSLDPTHCGGAVAKWLDEVPATPIDRFYGLTGVADPQHTQHLFAMQKLGLPGEPVNVSVGPPYGNSHRLVTDGGHEDVCALPEYRDVCNYLFDVPVENADGLP